MSANKQAGMKGFLLHLHPKKVNEQAIKYTRTFGLGGINALLFIILAFTGLILRFWYIPTPNDAYDSIVAMQNNSMLGSLIRNIHHWSSKLMVVTVFLHLLRVFYSTSIYYERRKNWYYGLVLFIILLAFNFTGYLLPWDQLSFWAVTIMTNIVEYIPFIGSSLADMLRGGEMVNGNTLLNFYNFHTALLPLMFIVFMSMHFWLIRKAKGVTIANVENTKSVDVNPNLIHKEIIVALILMILISVVSIFINAPLLEKANPMLSPNPSKAPWYFMGIQELLINLHPFIATLLVPLFLGIFLFLIPNNKINKDRVGKWYYSPKGKKIIIISVIFSLILSSVLTLVFEYALKLHELDVSLFVSTGVIPFLAYIIPFLAFIFYLKKIMKADKTELIISALTIILASYILMSIIGIWFRGEGMQLIF